MRADDVWAFTFEQVMYADRCTGGLALSLLGGPSWGMIARSWAFWCPFKKLTASSPALPPGYITACIALSSLLHAHTCMLPTCMHWLPRLPRVQHWGIINYILGCPHVIFSLCIFFFFFFRNDSKVKLQQEKLWFVHLCSHAGLTLLIPFGITDWL